MFLTRPVNRYIGTGLLRSLCVRWANIDRKVYVHISFSWSPSTISLCEIPPWEYDIKTEKNTYLMTLNGFFIVPVHTNFRKLAWHRKMHFDFNKEIILREAKFPNKKKYNLFINIFLYNLHFY